MSRNSSIKVLFVNNSLTHYYNLVLNRLNGKEGISLSVLVPSNGSGKVGEGVYQNREGLNFKVYELKEYKIFGMFPAFKGLAGFLMRERFDVVIVNENYTESFLLNPILRIVRAHLRTPLIMKSIPFMVPLYQERKQAIYHGTVELIHVSGTFKMLSSCTLLVRVLKWMSLHLRKHVFNFVDAHVNYIDDAFEIYGSYGVDKRKIFITRNSPDTDLLLSYYNDIRNDSPFLPPSQHRIVHVGRLVAWKRVDMLIRAFNRLRAVFPDAELLVIGTGPESDRLKKLSAELGCNDSVSFLGGIYDPQILGRYLVSSSVYVLAGMGGLSINDAMCFGLPVVCSVCDGTEKKLVRDGFNGFLFRDGDEDDLVEKIAFILEDQERRRKMGENSLYIIMNEVNIGTVISGYLASIKYVCGKKQ